MKKEYTVKEAAEAVGISDSRIRQLALANQIEHTYFGKMLVISAKGIRQAKDRKTKPGPLSQNQTKRAA